MSTPEEFLVVDDVSSKLHIKPDTVTALARRGDLRGSKRNGRWYFLPQDVAEYIEGGMNRTPARRRRRRAA